MIQSLNRNNNSNDDSGNNAYGSFLFAPLFKSADAVSVCSVSSCILFSLSFSLSSRTPLLTLSRLCNSALSICSLVDVVVVIPMVFAFVNSMLTDASEIVFARRQQKIH